MRTTKLTSINTRQPGVPRISKVNGTIFPPVRPKNDEDGRVTRVDNVVPSAKNQSLVVLKQPLRVHSARRGRCKMSTPLIAQLIATHLELPQTRQRRRTSFDNASKAYDTALANQRTPGSGTNHIKTA